MPAVSGASACGDFSSSNAFTERLKLKWPILQSPMGWLSTPALAAAVSNAGGLGGLGMWGFFVEQRLHRAAQAQVADPAVTDGLAFDARARRRREQCRRSRGPRHVGIFRRG